MDIAKIIESIGWSQSVLIGGIIFIFLFRKEISLKIKSIKSVSKSGVLMDQNQEIKTIQENDTNTIISNNDSIVIKEQKSYIIKDLKAKNLAIDNNNKTIDILIHELAITQLKLNFEKIYNIIFGSQINLLKKLNEGAKHQDYVEAYAKSVIENHAEMSNWDTASYLNFLFNNTLIIFDNEKKLYALTNYGHEFLFWLLSTGNSEDKNY